MSDICRIVMLIISKNITEKPTKIRPNTQLLKIGARTNVEMCLATQRTWMMNPRNNNMV